MWCVWVCLTLHLLHQQFWVLFLLRKRLSSSSRDKSWLVGKINDLPPLQCIAQASLKNSSHILLDLTRVVQLLVRLYASLQIFQPLTLIQKFDNRRLVNRSSPSIEKIVLQTFFSNPARVYMFHKNNREKTHRLILVLILKLSFILADNEVISTVAVSYIRRWTWQVSCERGCKCSSADIARMPCWASRGRFLSFIPVREWPLFEKGMSWISEWLMSMWRKIYKERNCQITNSGNQVCLRGPS